MVYAFQMFAADLSLSFSFKQTKIPIILRFFPVVSHADESTTCLARLSLHSSPSKSPPPPAPIVELLPAFNTEHFDFYRQFVFDVVFPSIFRSLSAELYFIAHLFIYLSNQNKKKIFDLHRK